MRIRLAVMLALLTLVYAAVPAGAADAPHRMYTPDAIKWGDAPPMVPKGAKLAVLYGDPGKEGLFVIRVKLPANYRIAAHSHPTDEIVSVLSGTLLVGMGDKLAPAGAKPFPTGSLVVAPANANHFVLTKQPVVIEISSIGPLAFNYVNPADDPSKK
ncbi:MAG TPA: cupin domain-containing protein [Methylomirabilota bacterium]